MSQIRLYVDEDAAEHAVVEGERLLDLLARHNVTIDVRADQAPFWQQILLGFLPWLLIIGLFLWSGRVLRRGMGAGGGAGGLMRGAWKSGDPDEIERRFVEQCLRDKGYQVIGWK